MAINAYTGLMGSGKSYEVVLSVILPAIENKRNVVTNIDGVNEDLIHQYLINKNPALDHDDLGSIIHVSNEVIAEPNFFPNDEGDSHSIVKYGDMVCIDEAWRFWAAGIKITDEHMRFFRMHRHYVNADSKFCCDLALMVQSIGDLNRQIKAVVEMTIVTHKLKTLGLHKNYRVDFYEGNKVVKGGGFDQYQKRYNPQIFPLYSSYGGGSAGSEKPIDSRQNILKNPKFLIIAVLAVLMILGGFYSLSRLFNKSQNSKPSSSAQSNANPAPLVNSNFPKPSLISEFRIAGEVAFGNNRYIVIQDSNSRFRYKSPQAFTNNGVLMFGDVDGQKVTTFSGIFNRIEKAPSLANNLPLGDLK